MKRYIGPLFILILVVLPKAGATNTDVRVRILPQNCIFDVVDVGTQQLIFYTPAECGVVIPPVDVQEELPSLQTPPEQSDQLPRPNLAQNPIINNDKPPINLPIRESELDAIIAGEQARLDDSSRSSFRITILQFSLSILSIILLVLLVRRKYFNSNP